MKSILFLIAFFIPVFLSASSANNIFEEDIIKTSSGDLKITFIGHGTLMFTFNEKVIHIDPWSKLADYSKLPKAGLILITHEHGDHLDKTAIKQISTDKTVLVYTETCSKQLEGGIVMKNGDSRTILEHKIEAVPAYNIKHKRGNNTPFHPKGVGNGYVLTFGDKKVYVAGDTENIPEMKKLKEVDIAFMPMNLPYTMTPEMTADAAKMFKPEILYPYHFGDTDTSIIVNLLKSIKDIDVRIRKMN